MCYLYRDSSCGSRYTDEIISNAEVGWNKHNNSTKSSKPSKIPQNNIDYCCTGTVIAPENAKTMKNLEA